MKDNDESVCRDTEDDDESVSSVKEVVHCVAEDDDMGVDSDINLVGCMNCN